MHFDNSRNHPSSNNEHHAADALPDTAPNNIEYLDPNDGSILHDSGAALALVDKHLLRFSLQVVMDAMPHNLA